MKHAEVGQCKQYVVQSLNNYILINTGASSLRYRRSFGLANVPIYGTIRHCELKIVKYAVLSIQRWWKQILLERRQLRAVIIVQSFIRHWHARKASNELRHSIFIIQVSHFCLFLACMFAF